VAQEGPLLACPHVPEFVGVGQLLVVAAMLTNPKMTRAAGITSFDMFICVSLFVLFMPV
jgi:hypothetical protein